jgi:PAS domain S-box-containing protein
MDHKNSEQHVQHIQKLNSMIIDLPYSHENLSPFFDDILSELLSITQSEYGFIGEILQSPENVPFLKTYALTNIAWNAETREFYNTHAPKGLEFKNLDTLFGYVIRNQEILISNDPYNDSRRGGLPDGHPEMNCFLGIPIFNRKGSLVGMAGLANKVGGYRENDALQLNSFLTSFGLIIQQIKLERKRKEAEKELLKLKDNLLLTNKIAKVGFWEIDIINKQIFWSEVTKMIFSISEDFVPCPFNSKQFFPKGETRNLIIKSINHCARTGESFDIKLKITTKDNLEKWVRTIGYREKTKGIYRVFGTFQDISQEKFYEDKLFESQRKLQNFFDLSPDLLAIADKNGDFSYINKTFSEILGYTDEEIVGQNYQKFIHPDDIPYSIKEINKKSKDFITLDIENRFKKKNRDYVWINWRISEDYNNSTLIFSGRDITLIKQEQIEQEKNIRKITIQSKIISQLNSLDAEEFDEPIEIYKVATKYCAEGLDVFRCSIWLYNQERNSINLKNLYLLRENIHTVIDLSIDYNKYPKYLKALDSDSYIIASNAHENWITSPFSETYLKANNINSLLDIPLRLNGVTIGVLCCEDDFFRDWKKDDIFFLENIAIFLILSLQVLYRKKAKEELIKAREEAIQASKAKSEFLANMSHEIRTPLNGVIGFTDLLLKTQLSNAQKQYVENVNIAGKSLLGIINDILDFSKIEAGKLEFELIETNLFKLLEEAIDIIKYHAAQKNLELLINIYNNPNLSVFVDPLRFKQILTNLLSNAIKFTEKGEIELRLIINKISNTEGLFMIEVRDTGIGISQEQQTKLFQAFSQADSSTTRKYGGTGLGLIISNLLAHKMGTSIKIESKIGEGSKFYFEVKLPFKSEVKNDQLFNKIKHILYIYNNYKLKNVVENISSHLGIQCVGFDNPIKAFLAMEKDTFDTILVDSDIPYMSALEIHDTIREKLSESYQKIPVVFVESFISSNRGVGTNLQDMGYTTMIKPIEFKNLTSLLLSIEQGQDYIQNSFSLKDDPVSNDFVSLTSFQFLVVEDILPNLILVKSLLKKYFPNSGIWEANNGYSALSILENKSVDLILMDVQMPELDGLQTTKMIRKKEKQSEKRIPIIALTAGALKEEKEKALQAGMDDFLTKPIDQTQLLKVLKKHLN